MFCFFPIYVSFALGYSCSFLCVLLLSDHVDFIYFDSHINLHENLVITPWTHIRQNVKLKRACKGAHYSGDMFCYQLKRACKGARIFRRYVLLSTEKGV